MQQQDVLDKCMEAALAYGRRIVKEAEEAVARVAVLPEGVNKKLEVVTATSSMSEARGVLATLRILRPGDVELNNLWSRLNHCPVIMLVGVDQAEATRPHVQ